MRPKVGVSGSEITLVYSLRSDGSLLGKPRISHAKLSRDKAAQGDFLAATLEVFAHCLPISITNALGRAITGPRIRLRLINQANQFAIGNGVAGYYEGTREQEEARHSAKQVLVTVRQLLSKPPEFRDVDGLHLFQLFEEFSRRGHVVIVPSEFVYLATLLGGLLRAALEEPLGLRNVLL